MKKRVFAIPFIFAVSALFLSFFACKSIGSSSDEIDYRMLQQPAEVKKWCEKVSEKMGEHRIVTDEVTMNISRPAVDGTIIRKGVPDEMTVAYSYKKDGSKNTVVHQSYMTSYGKWMPAQDQEIHIMGSHPEDYKIEDDLFDFSKVSVDNLNKAIANAVAKYTETKKYKDLYVNLLEINEKGFNISLHGRLLSNEQQKNEYYQADFDGNPKE